MSDLLNSLDDSLPGGELGTLLSYPPELRFLAAKGNGSKLYDENGNEYLDLLMGSGPLILGHCHPAVMAAAKAQLEQCSTCYQPTPSIAELAELIVSASPCAGKLRFVTTGAEATYYAMRLARAFTGREKIVKCAGAYHGCHDYSLVGFLTGDYDPLDAPVNSAGIPEGSSRTVMLSDFNDLDMAADLMRQHGDSVAAIILEPILGVVPPRDGFLQGLRELADKYGSLLIFDEMITGFRLAWGGAQEAFSVVPDLACYGKIIGGGYPTAAVCGREDVLNLSVFANRANPDYVLFSGTFYANPMAAAAGAATLRELAKPGMFDRLNQVGTSIRSGLRDVVDDVGIPAQVVGTGPVYNVFFTDQPIVNHRQIMSSRMDLSRDLLLRLARERVLISSSKGWLSTVHDEADVARAVDAYRKCLTDMVDAGLLQAKN
ncbi:MAG: aminotransferase class III-fold pyridoxal phosphate-dependent enzyme [Gammaproteobacteria bacterium]|nr:aminotransferase class III-fold pyridoxal phosphate-dependent enzyme [Gammaproteobacteria bacterium]